jgi:hypothetical protein
MSKKSFYSLLVCLIFFSVGMPPLEVSRAQSGSCNNVLRGAVIIEYSSSYSDDFAPENLIDGRENRSWSSAEDDEQPYVVFDLGEVFEIDRMQLNGYYQANDPAYEGDSVRNFRLEASVEDQWSTVFEGESPLVDRLVNYQFPAPVVTNQVKVVFLSNYGGTAFEAAELVVCGQRATASETTGSGESGGKRPGDKENPQNEPLLFIQGDLPRDTTETWSFDAKASQVVSIELQATTQYTYLELLGPSGQRMEEDSADQRYIDNTYSAGIYGVQILEDGTYSIRISSGIGPYTLQVYEGYFGYTVGNIDMDQPAQGRLAENGVDGWLITLSAGEIISLELQATTQYTYLGLFDPVSRRIEEDSADERYVNNTYRAGIFGVHILEDGLYMILVSSGIGPYTLEVNEGYFGHTVGTVTVNQSVQGTLAENGFDRWLITLSAEQTISIDLQATTQYTYLQLFDPIGRRVDDDGADQSQGTRYRANIESYQVLTTGLYMIRISDGIGDYTLSVSGQ